MTDEYLIYDKIYCFLCSKTCFLRGEKVVFAAKNGKKCAIFLFLSLVSFNINASFRWHYSIRISGRQTFFTPYYYSVSLIDYF